MKYLVRGDVCLRFLAEPRNDRGKGLGMAGLNGLGSQEAKMGEGRHEEPVSEVR